ncbi:hypothetical protein KY320_01730 [Candidatus Woesearchaeota archaeon]|nr:hypothetical protein [Candidatus Woesearchaeota archaeon]
MGVRGVVRDIVFIYLGVRLLGVWLFDAPFTNTLGVLVVLLLLTSVWFFLQRFGVLPKG